jgi:hypothetical protein
MKIAEEVTVYDSQGEGSSGATDTQPTDPGKSPFTSSHCHLTHSRLRQVAPIRAFHLVEGMGSNVSYQGKFLMLLIIAIVI